MRDRGSLSAFAEGFLGGVNFFKNPSFAFGRDGGSGSEANVVAGDGIQDGVHIAERGLTGQLLVPSVFGHPVVGGLTKGSHSSAGVGVALLHLDCAPHL